MSSFRVRSFHRGGKKVRVYGVAHLGTKEEMEWLKESVTRDYHRGYVVHQEGVKGSPHENFKNLYRSIAENTSLVAQPEPDVPHEIHDATYNQLNWVAKTIIGSIEVLIQFMKDSNRLEEFATGVEEAVLTKETPWKFKYLGTVLGGKRERIAVKAALREPKDVIMIWGTDHLESFTRRLKRVGFTVTGHEGFLEV